MDSVRVCRSMVGSAQEVTGSVAVLVKVATECQRAIAKALSPRSQRRTLQMALGQKVGPGISLTCFVLRHRVSTLGGSVSTLGILY